MTKQANSTYKQRRKSKPKKSTNGEQSALPTLTNGAAPDIHFEDDLWDAAVKLRGNIAPADYKHYVLPLLFLRYLSLKYERRRDELEKLIHDANSGYFTDDDAVAQEILNDPDEYKSRNVFVIPDEAHRTQYGFKRVSCAMQSRTNSTPPTAFPNISATRCLTRPSNAADIALLSWADFEKIAGTTARLKELARDIVAHFEERTQTLQGKGMIVWMSRRICVALFNQVVALRPEWYARPDDAGQIKIVMTGDLARDPTAWNEAGHITTKERREKIKARFKNIDDPLKLVIVRDMWLTGTDIPALHTLYVDKPMKGHNLMQAVARVNRIFRDKPGGVVVDYIGIGSELKQAARKYTAQGYGEPVEELEDAARKTLLLELEHIRVLLPESVTVSNWRALDNIAQEDLASRLYAHFIEPDDVRDAFLDAEKRLSSAFALVAHLDDCRAYADEVAFYQLIRAELNKARPKQEGKAAHAQAVQDLINRSIVAQDALDIYKLAGITNPDISILDDEFLQEYKHQKLENVRLKLLEKLLMDEIFARQRMNLRKYRSLEEALQEALQKYHNNALTAAEVVRQMIEIRNQIREADRRKSELGLSDEELAFYDSIAGFGEERVFDVPYLAELTREIVQAVKRNLKVDWTKPHRQDVKAEIRAQVKNVLRRRGVRAEQFQFILARVMKQAEAMYEDYPMAA